VTLRGPVNSQDEKDRVGEIARQLAADGNVDNQLEVKVTPLKTGSDN
jgi:osmotically-inducible protein OsmY